MKSNILDSRRKMVAQLIDPDKFSDESLSVAAVKAAGAGVDFFLAGGSLTSTPVDALITRLRQLSDIPIILFPGNLIQLTDSADAIFLLSLISGRNPELLIGNHVVAAPFLKHIRERLIPVGYILVNCGGSTSVEYMSQTAPVPYDKNDIAVATALAGEMLGMKAVYLEGGSGAARPVNTSMIRAVREEVSIPIIVGGGLNSREKISEAFSAGADFLVIGNGCEKNPALITEACSVRDNYNKKIISI